MKTALYLTASLVMAIVLNGCASMNQSAEKVANTVTPQDIVTGQRTLNLESPAQEIKRATQQTAQILADAKKKGHGIDDQPAEVKRLNTILHRLAAVSHRPNLPWEIHLIDSPTVNAFTIGGGKIFVYQGLFGSLIDPNDDDQLAAVVAHEMGHDAYRHVSKSISVRELSLLSKKVRSAVDAPLYEASYTTLQEEQADRISLLYMALAGYNPTAAPGIWARAKKKFGSDPGDFLYDHPLNADREKMLASLAPIAMKYYRGEGIQNSDYPHILLNNALIRRQTGSSGNGFVDLLTGAVGTYNDHLKAENEALKREMAMEQELGMLRQSTALHFSIAPTTDGHQGFFGDVHNFGTQSITSLQIAVYYYGADGRILYTQPIALQPLNLAPGAITKWSAYMLAVPNTARVAASIAGGSIGH
ncbi:MAG: M48 family metallopeptidase [Acidiferrobacterales bacterium]